MSVEVLLTRYNLSARAEGLSPKTVRAVTLAVKLFDQFIGSIPDVSKVSADDLRRFVVSLRERHRWQGRQQESRETIGAVSANTYCRGVKSFWSWLARENIIKSNPLALVPAPKLPKKLPKVLTEDELKKMLKAAARSDRDAAIVNLLLDSGIRASELIHITPDEVQNDRIKIFGKGSKERMVFVSEETRVLITLYHISRPDPVGDNRLFLTEDGRPITSDRLQKILVDLGKRAGINTRLSAHRLRHCYGSLALKYGANLEYIRRTMGHSDSKTTEIYLQISDTDVAQAYRKFSPVTNLMAKKPGS